MVGRKVMNKPIIARQGTKFYLHSREFNWVKKYYKLTEKQMTDSGYVKVPLPKRM